MINPYRIYPEVTCWTHSHEVFIWCRGYHPRQRRGRGALQGALLCIALIQEGITPCRPLQSRYRWDMIFQPRRLKHPKLRQSLPFMIIIYYNCRKWHMLYDSYLPSFACFCRHPCSPFSPSCLWKWWASALPSKANLHIDIFDHLKSKKCIIT